MSKKLLVSILTITLTLSACGTVTSTAKYDKVAQKAYRIGEALGKSEGSFRKVTLSEDDVSFSEESASYSESVNYFAEYEEAVNKFAGDINFENNIKLTRILLQHDGQTAHLKNVFTTLYKDSLNIMPAKYQWYFKYAYQTSFLKEVIQRFLAEDGWRAPGENFAIQGFAALLTDIAPELKTNEKRALENLASYESATGLTAEELREIQENLAVLLEAF